MVTPAIVGKVNERMVEPGNFSWDEKEEIFAMDLRPAKTTWGLVKADGFTGVGVPKLGPKATLEAQMEAAARHAFDYGGKLPPLQLDKLPEAAKEAFASGAASSFFGGQCHNCGLKGHRANECRGADAYQTDGSLIVPDQNDQEQEVEDITQIPAEWLVEGPIGAIDPIKAEEERKVKEEHDRITAERGRLTQVRRAMMKMIKEEMKKTKKIGQVATNLWKTLGGGRGLFFGDVPGAYEPTPKTCSQLRTLFNDGLCGGDPRPLMISISRAEGVLRKRGTRYAAFVWWGIEEVCREIGDNYNHVIAGVVERAWQMQRERDEEEEDITSGAKRLREGKAETAKQEEYKRRKQLVQGLSGAGQAALAAWKDGQETLAPAEPVEFADVEGDEIRFEAWFGGGARYCVNDEPRNAFVKAKHMPADPPQFPNSRIRVDAGKEFRSVQLPDKHAGVIEQLIVFFDACNVQHNLKEGPPDRYEIEGQSFAERAKACRAALMLTAPPPVAEGRWS